MKVKKYYIEFLHENSEAENYDMQSKWFDTKKEAKEWYKNNFDFVSSDMYVYLMTAVFNEDESYDIINSETLQ